jgi:DNA-binding protein YbaB
MHAHPAEADDLLTQYRRRLAEIGELRHRIEEISGTASSGRQSVKVTVNVRGEITALEFPTAAYKRTPPAELSAEILAAVRDAKARAQDQFNEQIAPRLPAGSRLFDIAQGAADPTEHFGSEPPMPDAVRDYIRTGRPAWAAPEPGSA